MTTNSDNRFGNWLSPITTEILTDSTIHLSQPICDGDDLYWLEMRPKEKGRCVIVRYSSDGNHIDITPKPFNVRSKAHEYGGRCYDVRQGVVYFSNFNDQRIYKLESSVAEAIPEAITPHNHSCYADHNIDPSGNFLLCVKEDHDPNFTEAQASIIAIELENHHIETLISGDDFYAYPSVNPAADKLCWISWNHPDMPWDNTKLWIAELHDLKCSQTQDVTDSNRQAVFQPRWFNNQTLIYVSDKDNWWNLYHYNTYSQSHKAIHPQNAEHGLPLWNFGMSTYDVLNDSQVACCFTKEGRWHAALLNIENGKIEPITSDYEYFSSIVCSTNKKVYCLAANPKTPAELISLSPGNIQLLKTTSNKNIHPDYFSEPQAITYEVPGNELAHGFYYPPHNPDYSEPNDEKPPLIVMAHGGPTAATDTTLNLKVQFWTSRGFAVLDVNYRGSTGYGREYRELLKRNWGIKDVEDMVYGARHLAKQQIVDPKKQAIRGGSAGGYTVLCALTFFTQFNAGTSLYGIGDLEVLVKDTHKFESRYLDTLVGPYPEFKQIYLDRSPLHHANKIQSPCLFLQGLNDKVVPPNQTRIMVEALEKNGTPVACIEFKGEGHGFRQAETIQTALKTELYFYRKIFGLTSESEIPLIEIRNL